MKSEKVVGIKVIALVEDNNGNIETREVLGVVPEINENYLNYSIIYQTEAGLFDYLQPKENTIPDNSKLISIHIQRNKWF